MVKGLVTKHNGSHQVRDQEVINVEEFNNGQQSSLKRLDLNKRFGPNYTFYSISTPKKKHKLPEYDVNKVHE